MSFQIVVDFLRLGIIIMDVSIKTRMLIFVVAAVVPDFAVARIVRAFVV